MTDKKHQQLISYFERYIKDDKEVIKAIQTFGQSFQLTNNSWQFTLHDLHQFCAVQVPSIENLDYQSFKQLLYQNTTNQIMSCRGGKFDLLLNSGHIEKSIYCLIRGVE
ncbi:MAG: hypothetical protein ACI9V8_001592 [Urechidicola sp.]